MNRIVILAGTHSTCLIDHTSEHARLCAHMRGVAVEWTKLDSYDGSAVLTVSLDHKPWAITEDPDGNILILAGERGLWYGHRVLWRRADAVELDAVAEESPA